MRRTGKARSGWGTEPNRPTVSRGGAGHLKDYEQRFADGDEWALVQALETCALNELVLPDWAARQWLRRIRSAGFYQAGSWDDVLPRIKPKGSKLSALRTARRWGLLVRLAVHAASKTGTPIDDELFAKLATAKRWPFSGALAKKLYYRPHRKTSTIRRKS